MGKSTRGCFATLAIIASIAIILVVLIGNKIIPSPFSHPSGGTSFPGSTTNDAGGNPTPTNPPSFGVLVVNPFFNPNQYVPCNNINLGFRVDNTGGQALTWALVMSYFNGPVAGDPIDNHLHASIGGARVRNGSGGTIAGGQSIEVRVTGGFSYGVAFQIEFNQTSQAPYTNDTGYELSCH